MFFRTKNRPPAGSLKICIKILAFKSGVDICPQMPQDVLRRNGRRRHQFPKDALKSQHYSCHAAQTNIFAPKKITAQCKLFCFCPDRKQPVMPYPHKPFRWYMHQETAHEFHARQGQGFPISLIAVIFHEGSEHKT